MNTRDWRFWFLATAGLLFACYPGGALYVGPVLIGAVAASRRPYRLDRADWAAASLVVWTALSIFWSTDLAASLHATFYLAVACAVFVGIRSAVRSGGARQDLLATATGFLAGSIVLVARITVMWASHPSERPNLPGDNANYAAYTFTASLAILVVTAQFIRLPRWAIFGYAVAATLGTVETGSRGALVSIGVLAAWLAIVRYAGRTPLLAMVIVVGVVAVITATSLAQYAAAPVEGSLGRGTGSWSGRLELWPLARNLWAQHPIFGAGSHTFATQNPYGVAAHNVILELGSGTGAIGVALFLATLALALRARSIATLVGAWLAVSALSYLTGSWDNAAPGWLALALVSAAAYCQGPASAKAQPSHNLESGGSGPESGVVSADS